MTRNINWELSADIIELIFSKLFLLNLPTCRVICKAWNKLVLTSKISYSNLLFAHISPYYSNLHYVDLDPQHLDGIDIVASYSFLPSWSSTMVKIFDSCNGLLLASSFLFDYTTMKRPVCDVVCILNPMTNEYIKIFSPSKAIEDIRLVYYYGFGFSLKTKQYKIVRYSSVLVNKNGPIFAQVLVEILAFGTGSTSCQWTPVGCVPLVLEGHGAYFNGSLYWVGFHRHRRPSTNVIFRFDVEDEIFEEISFPKYGEPGVEPLSCFFGGFNGTLYLTFRLLDLSEYQVWRLEEDSSWIKTFVVPILDVLHLDHRDQLTRLYYRSYHLQLIKACEDGKILCLYAGLDLILYDPTTETTQILTRQDVRIKKHLLLYQIDCFNFDPLHKILAGDLES